MGVVDTPLSFRACPDVDSMFLDRSEDPVSFGEKAVLEPGMTSELLTCDQPNAGEA